MFAKGGWDRFWIGLKRSLGDVAGAFRFKKCPPKVLPDC
jgi:hypothetical protein